MGCRKRAPAVAETPASRGPARRGGCDRCHDPIGGRAAHHPGDGDGPTWSPLPAQASWESEVAVGTGAAPVHLRNARCNERASPYPRLAATCSMLRVRSRSRRKGQGLAHLVDHALPARALGRELAAKRHARRHPIRPPPSRPPASQRRAASAVRHALRPHRLAHLLGETPTGARRAGTRAAMPRPACGGRAARWRSNSIDVTGASNCRAAPNMRRYSAACKGRGHARAVARSATRRPAKPAQQAMQHHQQGLIGKAARIPAAECGCAAAAARARPSIKQLDSHVVEKQPKAATVLRAAHPRRCRASSSARHRSRSCPLSCGAHRGRRTRRPTRRATASHKALERGRWHACARLGERLRRDAAGHQHPLAPRAVEPRDRARNERGGHRVRRSSRIGHTSGFWQMRSGG